MVDEDRGLARDLGKIPVQYKTRGTRGTMQHPLARILRKSGRHRIEFEFKFARRSVSK